MKKLKFYAIFFMVSLTTGVIFGFYLGSFQFFDKKSRTVNKEGDESLHQTQKRSDASSNHRTVNKEKVFKPVKTIQNNKKLPNLFQVLSRGDKYLKELEKKGEKVERFDFAGLEFSDGLFKITHAEMNAIKSKVAEIRKSENGSITKKIIHGKSRK